MPALANEPPNRPRIRYGERFLRDYAKTSPSIQKAFDKQARILLTDPRHRSLRAAKYETQEFAPIREVWYARATLKWRFFYTIVGDTYWFLALREHPK